MAAIVKKSLSRPEETQTLEKVKVETVTIEGLKFQRVSAEPGWQWSKHMKPVVGGESCQKEGITAVPTDAVRAIHNAYRGDIATIDTAP